MREIVFDTETTGLDPANDRITDIACVELVDKEPTGRVFQQYLNPDKILSEESITISGLTNEFLSDKPRFIEIIDNFLQFIGDATLVAHNATFDMNFLNSELKRIKYPIVTNQVIDTLDIARRKFQSGNSLNALCKRYKISLSGRSVHGALIDAKLLAKVYGYLCIEEENFSFSNNLNEEIQLSNFVNRPKIIVSDNDLQLHLDMINKIKSQVF
jgi:DNA polymerase-3 subunit epsilon